jgi:hypothetical protein
MKNEKDQSNPVEKPSRLPIAVIAVALALIIAPLWVTLPAYLFGDDQSDLQDLDGLAWEINKEINNFIHYNASETLVGEQSILESYSVDTSLDLENAETKLNEYFQTYIDDYYLNKGSDVKIEITDHNIHIDLDYQNTDDSELGTNEITVEPVYYKISGEYTIKLTDTSSNLNILRVFSFDKTIYLPEPFLRSKLNEYQNNALTEASDIGRMVRYMLNTLARYRAKIGYGQGPFDSPRNILNEGDIELAVNLAIVLEEAYLFRAYNNDAVKAIDSNYFDLSDLTRAGGDKYNPTGKRLWGDAEISNYNNYVKHLPASPAQRSLTSLFNNYVIRGLLDPTDLFALYLCLDNDPYPDAIDIDPADEVSIPEDESLLNPRQTWGPNYDATNLEYILNVNVNDPFEFWDENADKNNNLTNTFESIEVDHFPDYLVAGSTNLEISNLYPPRGWYTNVDLDTCYPNNLTTVNGSLGGRRCPKLPPPPRPIDHDFQMQWDLEIKGSFDLTVCRDPSYKVADGARTNPWYSQTIDLDFKVPVYLWLRSLPQNNAIVFENLNTGVLDNETAEWIIEPEAIASEYFTEFIWKNIRPLVGENFEYSMNFIDLVLSNGFPEQLEVDHPNDLKSRLMDMMLVKDSELQVMVENDPPWWELITFMDTYLEVQGLIELDFGPIWIDGYEIVLENKLDEDYIIIYVMTDYGHIDLKFDNIHNINTRNIIFHHELYIEDIINYNEFFDMGLNTESYGVVAGNHAFSAEGTLFNDWELTIYSYLIYKLARYEPTDLYSIELRIPIGDDNQFDTGANNLTISFSLEVNRYSDSDKAELVEDKLRDIGDAFNQAKINYDSTSQKSLEELVENVTTQIISTLNNLNIGLNSYQERFSMRLDSNQFFNSPVGIILSPDYLSNNNLQNALEWLSDNCIEIISYLETSSMPMINILELLPEVSGREKYFNGIYLIFTSELGNNDDQFELSINFTEDNRTFEDRVIQYFATTSLDYINIYNVTNEYNFNIFAGYQILSEPFERIDLYSDIVLISKEPINYPSITVEIRK